MTFTLELLRRILKVFNPVNLDCNTYLKKKTPIVFCVFTVKASQNDLINGFKTSLSRSKGLK